MDDDIDDVCTDDIVKVILDNERYSPCTGARPGHADTVTAADDTSASGGIPGVGFPGVRWCAVCCDLVFANIRKPCDGTRGKDLGDLEEEKTKYQGEFSF